MSNSSWPVNENGLTHVVPATAEPAAHDRVATAPAEASRTRESLETRLLREGYVTADQLSELVRHHVQTQRPIDELVVELGLVPPSVLEGMSAERVAPTETSVVQPASLPGEAADQTSEEPCASPAPAELRALPAWEPIPAPGLDAIPTTSAALDITHVEATDVVHLDNSPTAPSVRLAADEPQVQPDTIVALSSPADFELEPDEPTLARVAFDVVLRAHTGPEITTKTHASRAAAQEDMARLARSLSDDAGDWLETDNWMIRREAIVGVGVRTRLAAD